MKAVILAGGRGTRLAPYTTVFPKPLVPISDRPIIDIILQQLAQYGITDVTISLGHLGHLIQAYYAAGSVYGLRLSYVSESQPLGTAGSLTLVPGLDSTFLVMNGDILSTLDYHALICHHRTVGAGLTIATHLKEVRIDLGVLETGAEDLVIGYHEKPVKHFPVSMGIYIYEPRILKLISPGEYLDFPDLVTRAINACEKVVAYKNDAVWLDIGRREDYEDAQRVFEERRREFIDF